MVKTRTTDYDTMADVKELMEFLRKQREDDERRRKEEKEEEERRRKEERQEEDRRRKREREEDLDRWMKILGQFQDKTKEKFQDVEEKFQDVKKEFQGNIQDVHNEILGKCTELEQRMIKKVLEESAKPGGSGAAPVSVTQGHLKPPTFDGETSRTMYKRQFEAAALTNEWSDQQKATALVLALRGKALEILQNIPEAKQEDYATVVGALELRYGNKYLSQVYQSQLKSRVQGSTETLQEFSADIERMVRLAYPQAPEDFVNQISVQCFVDGVRDVEMQHALRLGRFKNLAEVVIYSLEYEAATNASSCRRGRIRELKVVDQGQSGDDDIFRDIKDLVNLLKKQFGENKDRDIRQVTCYSCGQKGHYSRNCRHRSRSED